MLCTDLYGKAGRAWLRAVPLPEITRPQVDLLLELIDAVDVRVKRLDQRIRKNGTRDAAAERLQTVPGIGPFGALLLLAEIGRIDRFASSHQLAAYAGLVPSTRSSGDKTSHGTVDGSGSPWLKWILIEIVQTLKLAPGADWDAVSEAAAVEGEGEGDGCRGNAETVLLLVLDVAERLELRGVGCSNTKAGGAPGASAGVRRVVDDAPVNTDWATSFERYSVPLRT